MSIAQGYYTRRLYIYATLDTTHAPMSYRACVVCVGATLVDEETRHYADIIRAKQDRLNILDVQAARYGIDVPPHIAMERVSLEAELRAVETTLDSPIRADLGDELGPRGRFVVNHQQNLEIQKQNTDIEKLIRETKQSIAHVATKLDRFIDDSKSWRNMHRNVILIIGVAVLITFGIVIAIVTYLFTTGAL